jgi:hypothetical protein
MQPNKSQHERQPIFIHSRIDDFGLSPFEFRVYAHLARRGNGAWAGIRSIAKTCRMTKTRASAAIKALFRCGLITGRFKAAHRSSFNLVPMSEWPGNCPSVSDGPKTQLSDQGGQQLSDQGGHKEIQQGEPRLTRRDLPNDRIFCRLPSRRKATRDSGA